MATPCSVKAIGKYLAPPQLEVTICDLQSSNSRLPDYRDALHIYSFNKSLLEKKWFSVLPMCLLRAGQPIRRKGCIIAFLSGIPLICNLKYLFQIRFQHSDYLYIKSCLSCQTLFQKANGRVPFAGKTSNMYSASFKQKLTLMLVPCIILLSNVCI